MSTAAALDRVSPTSPSAGRVALKSFFNIMEKWQCSAADQRVLLGGIGTTTYHKYRKLPEVRLPNDTLERISYVMGIHKALRILFSNKPEMAHEWVRRHSMARVRWTTCWPARWSRWPTLAVISTECVDERMDERRQACR